MYLPLVTIEHHIETGEARPIKQRMRRTPAVFQGEEEGHLDRMLAAGVIQPSTSDWAAAPVLIRKKDGSVRWCVDYRALNKVTVKDTYPLPLIEECLDTLAGNLWFSKLDANAAYWQIKVNPEDRKKTAFITKYGLFEFTRMGFGLCHAPATFARAINHVLHRLNWKIALVGASEPSGMQVPCCLQNSVGTALLVRSCSRSLGLPVSSDITFLAASLPCAQTITV